MLWSYCNKPADWPYCQACVWLLYSCTPWLLCIDVQIVIVDLGSKDSNYQTSLTVRLSDSCVSLLYSLWFLCHDMQIVIVDVGSKDSNYQEFVAKLPDNDCRFAGQPHTSAV